MQIMESNLEEKKTIIIIATGTLHPPERMLRMFSIMEHFPCDVIGVYQLKNKVQIVAHAPTAESDPSWVLANDTSAC